MMMTQWDVATHQSSVQLEINKLAQGSLAQYGFGDVVGLLGKTTKFVAKSVWLITSTIAKFLAKHGPKLSMYLAPLFIYGVYRFCKKYRS